MFLNFYKPFTPTYRNKVKVTSFLCSKKIKKNLKLAFFKKKVHNNHKFLGKSNCIYITNMYRPLLGINILVKVLKTSYSNCFFGFFEFFDGCVVVKKLSHGMDFFKNYSEYSLMSLRVLDIDKKLSLQKNYISSFGINFKFFLLRCSKTNKIFSSSAGSFCVIKNKEESRSAFFIKLPSKKCFFFNSMSTAFVGRSSNIYYRYTFFSSFSGKYEIKKKKQTTRGIAKNPVDHPNGGRSKIKKPFMNPWGRVAKKGK